MKCSDCKHGNGSTIGDNCPVRSYLPSTFSAGCAQHETAEAGSSLPAKVVPPEPRKKGGAINKTEAEYQRTYLRGMDARFESMTFQMSNGHKYTPDFIVFQDGKPVEAHEVKGSYALHSQQRARLAFDQAKVEFPGIKWVWATKTKEGWKFS